jgi:hypothetical protein
MIHPVGLVAINRLPALSLTHSLTPCIQSLRMKACVWGSGAKDLILAIELFFGYISEVPRRYAVAQCLVEVTVSGLQSNH